MRAAMVHDLDHNKHVVRAFTAAINSREWERLDDLVAADFVRHSHAAPGVRSRDDFRRALRREFETFPDARESIEDLLAESDRVAVRYRFRGTQSGPMGPYPASGKVLVADYLAIYRIANGVIAEAWAEWDNLASLVQLGHGKAETGD